MSAPHGRVGPLVAPGPELTDAQRTRYARHVSLDHVGELGQRRLCNAAVAIVGAGGLGSPVISYLAAAGVGRLGLIDDDVVETSNLQRQTIHGEADVGTGKATSAAAAVARINSDVAVDVHTLRLTATNALNVLSGYDLVVDGSDNTLTRYVVNDACVALGVPEVWGAIEQVYGQVAVFWGNPPQSRGVEPVQLRDVYPRDLEADPERSCARAGVLGALCGSVGSVMATEAIKLITGGGEPLLGQLLTIDDWSATQRTVPVRRAGLDALAEPGLAPALAATPPAPLLSASARADVTALDLALALDGPAGWRLLDVRPLDDHALPALPGATRIPLTAIADGSAAQTLASTSGPVAVYCHHGARSLAAARDLRTQGVDAYHLVGGALAWSELTGNYAIGE